MSKWFSIIILMGIIGLAKAHHWIRLIILAGMGLAGLYLLQNLAKDFNKIYNTIQNPIASLPKLFFARSKRSTNSTNYHFVDVLPSTETPEHPQIDWERILSRDPVSCTRSFICQLVATDPTKLPVEETNILRLVRSTSQKENWATKQLQNALKYGQEVSSPAQCRKKYKFCPYSSTTMMYLLRFFGGT